MRTQKIKFIKPALPLLFSIIAFAANAQKLPNIQQVSLRAPANVKIDGKPGEWNNQFQAYNKAADISYSVANDDDNLYLVMQATAPYVITSIIGYGFEFDIQKSDKKNDKDKISISYPITVGDEGSALNFFTIKTGVLPDTNIRIAIAVMNSNNKAMAQRFKYIIVTGIKGLDTLSVYNETGIKAAGQFDLKKIYALELCVPLKYLGLSINDISKFNYHMIINGYKANPNMTINIPPNSSQAYIDGMNQALIDLNLRMAQKYAHNDWWGEYTLAKK